MCVSGNKRLYAIVGRCSKNRFNNNNIIKVTPVNTDTESGFV